MCSREKDEPFQASPPTCKKVKLEDDDDAAVAKPPSAPSSIPSLHITSVSISLLALAKVFSMSSTLFICIFIYLLFFVCIMPCFLAYIFHNSVFLEYQFTCGDAGLLFS